MRHRIILGLAALSLFVSLHAQERPLWQPPCDEALKMGRQLFVDTYMNNNYSHSELGEDMAHQRYQDCRQISNAARLAKLPIKARTNAKKLDDALEKWTRAEIEASEYAAGGGTMFTHLAARSGAVRADYVADLITAFETKQTRDTKARVLANTAIAGTRKNLKTAHNPDAAQRKFFKDIGESTENYLQMTSRSIRLAESVFALLKGLPDGPAKRIAEYMRGMSTPADE